MIPTPLERLGLTRERVEAALRPHANIARGIVRSTVESKPKPKPNILESRLEREVKRLKRKGETELQIARALHVTRAVVMSILAPAKKGRGGARGDFFQPKLTDSQVRNIRKRYDEGDPLQSIAEYYGISKAAVSLIGSRQNRKGVKD